MIHRWPPNDAADGNGYGPDPKAPIRTQRRSLAQITMTRPSARIPSRRHRTRPQAASPPIAQEPRGRGLRPGSARPPTLGGRNP
jgi:hypothetical protein